ncbi:hypothetical protein DU508_00060 [Pedobacter chinensis]|uniref:CdiA toxin EC869-like domain-containing protein n=1 Tax=Pedobacter chinensis TaxID=2282421 RepID=A0A369Q580_9SPHI|nr:hypothetical protein [Pedobacter chinensis]RDC58437.1 hypothetical protein DU508_00060 [Pedobacter chinensis]
MIAHHLGNVLATISDNRLANPDGSYSADVLTANDYYAFGSEMPDRKLWDGVTIKPNEVTGRALDLVIPKGATKAQEGVIKSMTEYGKSQGVNVNVKVF